MLSSDIGDAWIDSPMKRDGVARILNQQHSESNGEMAISGWERFCESVDLVLLPAGFRTVTVQSSVVQNDGLLITYFDRERLTTAIVGISGTLSSSENNVLLPYVFFLLPDDKVRDVQVMFQVWCVQLCPSQFVIYVPQGKVSHALNACWRASVGAHHTAASKVCIHILLQIKKLVYVKKKRKKNNDSH